MRAYKLNEFKGLRDIVVTAEPQPFGPAGSSSPRAVTISTGTESPPVLPVLQQAEAIPVREIQVQQTAS